MFLIRVGEIVTIAGHDCTPCGVLPGIPQMRRIRRHHADGWAASTRGRLALILVLDQMTRTVFPTIRAPAPVMPMHRRCRRSVRSGHRTRTRLRRVHVPRDAHGPRRRSEATRTCRRVGDQVSRERAARIAHIGCDGSRADSQVSQGHSPLRPLSDAVVNASR
jgi:Bacterial protein of unknown function (DUF924)